MVIIINDSSSAGKTSIIKAIQSLYDKPLLHTGVDRFWAMIPDQYKESGVKAHEGYLFSESFDNDNKPVVHVQSGPFATYMDDTKSQVIKLLALRGHHVAVDEIFTREGNLENYVRALQGKKVYFVGIVCELYELERRKKERGNRLLGLAREAIDLVHTSCKDYYDLIVDSTDCDAVACAQKIIDFIAANDNPQGFKKMEAICKV